MFLGKETLIEIVPSLMNTSEKALNYYDSTGRNCLAQNEFQLKNFNYNNGFHYGMYNCIYESILESTIEQCHCKPNFANFQLKPPHENVPHCKGKSLWCYKKLRGNQTRFEGIGTDGSQQLCMSSCEEFTFKGQLISKHFLPLFI